MRKALFIAILLLCLILRFYKITEVPASLNWDEVSNAYNAYSILKTVKDEYGNFLPLANRSFDDYKPPAYMYFTIPSVWIFGLSEFAARLPSAVFGVLTCVAVFFLVKKLTDSDAVSYTSFFLLSITPWHIQFSRAGFEANVGLFFVASGFTFLLYAIGKYPLRLTSYIYFLISALFFALSFYSYHAYRIVVPLIVFSFYIIFRDKIQQFPKKLLITYIIVILGLISPLFLTLSKEAFLKRFEATSQNVRQKDIDKSIELIDQDIERNLSLGKYLHNRRVEIAKTYISNYLVHFDLNFLFLRGDGELRHNVQNMGFLYLFELPLLIFGFYRLFQKFDKSKLFILSWLLIAPLGAITGSEAPHAIRSYSIVIPLIIIASFSFVEFWKIIVHNKISIFVFAFIIFLSSLIYSDEYFKHYPVYSAPSWQFATKQAALITKSLEDKHSQITVDSHNIEQAYIFWLFYTKYDPADYQSNGSKKGFGKYVFDNNPPVGTKSLYVTNTLPPNFEKIQTVYFPDGEKALEIGSIQ